MWSNCINYTASVLSNTMKHILSIPALTAALLLCGCCSPGSAKRTGLEYQIYKLAYVPSLDRSDEFQKLMNRLASEGWTIVQVIVNQADVGNSSIVLSRPKR
jgi:hypothetical protein